MIAVLFADLIGVTTRGEPLDPEDLLGIQRPYLDRVRREIQRHGGRLEKYVGDAVVALFGAPVAHEDDSERAVRAALAMRDAIQDQNESDECLDLSIRVGVNTGEALVDLGARPDRGDAMAAGDTINTAARIQTAAPDNTVLVGELTYQATRDVIEYRAAEPIAAKGKSGLVTVWEAVRGEEPGKPWRSDGSAFVGRHAELERLLELWSAVREDRLPGFAFVTGLPGIGKSRLLREFARRIDDEAAIHWGRCLPYGTGITYWPVIEIVRSAAGILQTDDAEVVVTKLGAMLESFGVDAVEERRAIAGAAGNLLEPDHNATRRVSSRSANAGRAALGHPPRPPVPSPRTSAGTRGRGRSLGRADSHPAFWSFSRGRRGRCASPRSRLGAAGGGGGLVRALSPRTPARALCGCSL